MGGPGNTLAVWPMGGAGGVVVGTVVTATGGIALFIFAPVIIALMLAVAVVMATLFSAWGLLLIVGWFVFGHGHRSYWGSYRRSLHAASRWPARRTPGPRPWI